jgi:hypothetical protein
VDSVLVCADHVVMGTQPFTDEEYAFLRHVRFGELPPRVAPDELLEVVETDTDDELPHQAFDVRDGWGEAGRLY